MPSHVKEIKIEFKCDGETQGEPDLDKLEVQLCDGTSPTLRNEPDTGGGDTLWGSSNGFKIVQTNPFCITIGGRRICWG